MASEFLAHVWGAQVWTESLGLLMVSFCGLRFVQFSISRSYHFMPKPKLPASWAVHRALDLCDLGHQKGHVEVVASGSPVICAFARYIEVHELPPLPYATIAGQRGWRVKMALIWRGLAW